MPLSPQTIQSLTTSETPEITQITQYQSMGKNYYIHKADNEDIAEIIELLSQNTSNPTFLKIEGQKITDLGKLRYFLIQHETITKVTFSGNSYKWTTSDFNDEQSDDQPTERIVSGIGEKEEKNMNEILGQKKSFKALQDFLSIFSRSPADKNNLASLTSAYSKIKEIQNIKISLYLTDTTKKIKEEAVKRIFESLQYLAMQIFSNKDNFKGIKNTDTKISESDKYIMKMAKNKSLSDVLITLTEFVKDHSKLIGTPAIVKQFKEIKNFLNLIDIKDMGKISEQDTQAIHITIEEKGFQEEAKTTQSEGTKHYGRFEFNIPNDTLSLNSEPSNLSNSN